MIAPDTQAMSLTPVFLRWRRISLATPDPTSRPYSEPPERKSASMYG